MIKGIKLCVNHAAKVRKLDIAAAQLHFKPGYNVLIGPNGSGKSTVLEALAACPLCQVARTAADKTKYVTTETLNPLVGGGFCSREAMIQGIRAMFRSHGQGVLDSMGNQWHTNETVMLIDSPETGQDFKNSELIYQGLLKMAEQYQVIIATNSLVFMRSGHRIDLGKNHFEYVVDEHQRLLDELRGRPVLTP